MKKTEIYGQLTKVERRLIIAARGGATMAQLVERTGCSAAYAIRLMDNLVEAGFLTRVEPTRIVWTATDLITREHN